MPFRSTFKSWMRASSKEYETVGQEVADALSKNLWDSSNVREGSTRSGSCDKHLLAIFSLTNA